MNKLVAFMGILLILYSGCRETAKEEVAIINKSLQIPINRFEVQFMDIDTSNLESGLNEIEASMPNFTDLYFNHILSNDKGQSKADIAKEFLIDSSYIKLSNFVNNVYPDLDLGQLNPELAQAISRYLETFGLSEEMRPSIYTFISGFVYQTLVFDDGGHEGVAIALEMFLGDKFDYKKEIPNNALFSAYLTRTYNAQHMSKKIVEVLVEDKMPQPLKKDFLSLIIWGGKKLYIMDQILNFKSDTIIMEYTKEQLEWCEENQAEMWDFFFTNEMFYKTNLRDFNKLVTPAPTTPGMPTESPGATGNYMGWQIIKAFMQKHPKMTINQLIGIQNAQQILDESKYKPFK